MGDMQQQPFFPLADEEPGYPAKHASTGCSPNDITITISNQATEHSQLLAQPNTYRIVLAPCPASMCPPHSTVTLQILCFGSAIPVPPLISPTQQCIQQSHKRPSTLQHPMYLHPYQQKNPPEPHLLHLPLLPPFSTIYLPTKPTTPFHTHPFPAYIELNGDGHDNIPSWPTKSAIRFNSPCGLSSISLRALYCVINLAFNASPMYTIPQVLSNSKCPDRIYFHQGSVQQCRPPRDQRDHHKVHQVHEQSSPQSTLCTCNCNVQGTL
jgi:hypothetical protein